MARTDRTRQLAAVALACAALVAPEAHAQPSGRDYRVVDLGTLGGLLATAEGITSSGEVFGHVYAQPHEPIVFSWSAREGFTELYRFTGISAYVMDVSTSGHVVGYTKKGLGGRTDAFVVTRNGGFVQIEVPGVEQCTYALAVSNAGRVVGGTCTYRAFSWTEREGLVDLGTLGGTWAEATEVSDAGQVVGGSSVADGTSHAFSWTRRAGMIDLGTLGGRSLATAVSDGGHVVGWSDTAAGGPWHAFRWTSREGMIDLGTLGGPRSTAVAANDSGDVIGVADTADGSEHAFFWSAQTGMVDLGTLGGPRSVATAINQAGVVVGTSDTTELDAWGEHVQHAFAWSRHTGLVDLGVPGSYSGANAISARGEIAGFMSGAGGQHAVVWDPSGTAE